MSDENKTKTWKTKATVSTFEEASVIKGALLVENTNMLVKIRRSPKGDAFRIRFWKPEEPKLKRAKHKRKSKIA